MFNKLKTFYKRNRVYSILMLISTVCILSILIGIIVYFFGQTSKDVYGNRLDGLNKVKITEKKQTEIKDTLKSNEKVGYVNIDVRGKLVYVIITMKQGTHADAETIAQSTLEMFDEKEKAFYDIQFLVDNKGESEENFPIMGYIKSGNTLVRWTSYKKIGE